MIEWSLTLVIDKLLEVFPLCLLLRIITFPFDSLNLGFLDAQLMVLFHSLGEYVFVCFFMAATIILIAQHDSFLIIKLIECSLTLVIFKLLDVFPFISLDKNNIFMLSFEPLFSWSIPRSILVSKLLRGVSHSIGGCVLFFIIIRSQTLALRRV